MTAFTETPAPHSAGIVIRPATAADAESCGKICFEAFGSLSARHGFPNDFPSPEIPPAALRWMFAHPGFFCVVAELNGKIVGSNCLDERTPIAGVGPISIDPSVQNQTAGRQLMQAVLTRAAERGFPGVRLVQAAWHNRSLALYTKLGFIVREPLACMQGPPIDKTVPGYLVRPAKAGDVAACNDLCVRVHGHQRGGELSDGIEQGNALVAELNGRLTAYSSGLGFFGHAVGEGNADLIALLSGATEFSGPGILVPSRNSVLFRWCLDNGLRVVQTMTLMSTGLYNDPAGASLPSVTF